MQQKSLHDLYLGDFEKFLSIGSEVNVQLSTREGPVSINVRVHLDFEGKRKFVSAYLPELGLAVADVLRYLISSSAHLADELIGETEVAMGNTDGTKVSSLELNYESHSYFYCEQAIGEPTSAELARFALDHHAELTLRCPVYAERRRELDSLIAKFLDQYAIDQPAYSAALATLQTTLQAELKKAEIPAWITSRVKDLERLKVKVLNRALPVETGKPYKTVQDIFDDLVDLAGIRVSLYFPGQRNGAGNLIERMFKLAKEPIVYTGGTTPPSYARRFSGYWATHYRVAIEPSQQPQALCLQRDIRVEIQLASIVMHAWAEVEHDLQYKQLGGGLWEDEKRLLDQLNGLMLSGEMVLEMLQVAGERRRARVEDILKTAHSISTGQNGMSEDANPSEGNSS